MTRLYDATHGQVQEFIKQLAAVGFSAEQLRDLTNNPSQMRKWVGQLDEDHQIKYPREASIHIIDAFPEPSQGGLRYLLGSMDCDRLEDLTDWSLEELKNLQGIGKTRLEQIQSVLSEHGLALSKHAFNDPNRVKTNPFGHHAYRAIRRDKLDTIQINHFVDISRKSEFCFDSRWLKIGEIRDMDDAQLEGYYAPHTVAKIRKWIADNVW